MPIVRAGTGYGKTMIENGDVVGGIGHIAGDMVTEYTGYSPFDGHFDSKVLIQTWAPIIGTLLLHQFVGKKVNPMLRKIPFIGKYVGI